eukprot:889307-Pleurochrysis_carterae.AAC.1
MSKVKLALHDAEASRDAAQQELRVQRQRVEKLNSAARITQNELSTTKADLQAARAASERELSAHS